MNKATSLFRSTLKEKETYERIHIYPVAYEDEHDLESGACFCNPEIDFDCNKWIVIHRSCEA